MKGPPRRDKVRGLLAEALVLALPDAPGGDVAGVAAEVEEAMHRHCGGVKSMQYKTKYRSLKFNLVDPNNPDLRRRVLSREITGALPSSIRTLVRSCLCPCVCTVLGTLTASICILLYVSVCACVCTVLGTLIASICTLLYGVRVCLCMYGLGCAHTMYPHSLVRFTRVRASCFLFRA